MGHVDLVDRAYATVVGALEHRAFIAKTRYQDLGLGATLC